MLAFWAWVAVCAGATEIWPPLGGVLIFISVIVIVGHSQEDNR